MANPTNTLWEPIPHIKEKMLSIGGHMGLRQMTSDQHLELAVSIVDSSWDGEEPPKSHERLLRITRTLITIVELLKQIDI